MRRNPRAIPAFSGGSGDSDDSDGGGDSDDSDGGVDVGDVLDGGGSGGSDPTVGGGGDDSDDSGGGGSDPSPPPAPDPDPSPGGSSPPPSDVGGGGGGDSDGDAGIDPSETPAAGVVGDPGGEIDPSDTPAAGTIGDDGDGIDPSGTPAAGTIDDRGAEDPSDTPAATEFEDPLQGVETQDGRVGEIAAEFEQEILDDRGLAPDDVRITRDGDQLTAELTGTGQTELRSRAVDEARNDAERQARLDRRQNARDADPTADGLQGGDARLFNQERELRREAAAREEQFGDIAVDSPVSDNRLEADLETGAEQFRDTVAGLGATTSSVGAPVAATGQLPEPGQSDRADLEGLDSQVFESAGETFNPFGLAAGGKRGRGVRGDAAAARR